MDKKEEFVSIYKKHIHRKGTAAFLDYLLSDKSDFFTAPASTRYHGSYPEGLVEHSLNVYYCLKDYLSRSRVKDIYGMNYDEESIAIVALLHDVCKINVYKIEMRNKKIDGVWKQVPAYIYEDDMPYGHGEKSVYILSGFFKLKREEAFAIRYHMGFSSTENASNVSYTFEHFPLSFALSTADMEATYFLDGKNKKEPLQIEGNEIKEDEIRQGENE